MRCESFLDRFDRLDAGVRPPAALKRHLGRCPSCAATVARESAAIAAARAEAGEPCARPGLLEGRIMDAVRLSPQPRREMTLGRWLVPGSLLAVAIALIPVGMDLDWLRGSLGQDWELPLALVLGIGFTAYGALFVGTHLEELGPLVRRAGGER